MTQELNPDILPMFENLIKFLEINKTRDSNGETTLCKTSNGVRERTNLPCESKDANGEYIVKCEDCPFSSVEAAQETVDYLTPKLAKYKMKLMLLGHKIE